MLEIDGEFGLDEIALLLFHMQIAAYNKSKCCFRIETNSRALPKMDISIGNLSERSFSSVPYPAFSGTTIESNLSTNLLRMYLGFSWSSLAMGIYNVDGSIIASQSFTHINVLIIYTRLSIFTMKFSSVLFVLSTLTFSTALPVTRRGFISGLAVREGNSTLALFSNSTSSSTSSISSSSAKPTTEINLESLKEDAAAKQPAVAKVKLQQHKLNQQYLDLPTMPTPYQRP
ncbi:beff4417-86e4-45af-bc13-92cc7777112d-CDS [Sclerotinia trifoliorum]|uniref:Beff4417-86e4-45af-bc13-92cc7777112d-CDS n=1 Tax=Sclerotinia trifoliorum TaxID=28548 RepID=A0A8H2VQ44_9HELO|nr:beff4417-86e4-45af-bc13-92cc7777112d-CDS [Sclerotinia trifoliorum]